jgi:hypothetical protein
MAHLDFDVGLLKILTTAMLSMWNKIHLFDNDSNHKSRATYTGNNSRKVMSLMMSDVVQACGHLAWAQLPVK